MQSHITLYPKIDIVLKDISQSIINLLKDKLVGIYLFGSLSYGDFDPGRSDIDLLTLVNTQLNKQEIDKCLKLHLEIEEEYSQWLHRIENSFTPVSMLNNIQPPNDPRPYYNDGEIWQAQYGNEWIINLYLLDKHGITLFGKDIHKLIKNVDITDVQKACIKDLYKEWEPKLREPEWLENSHYQSYLVLNLCRILYTVFRADVCSKKVSADWVKTQYPQWANLINTAQNWHYGIQMLMQKETLEFLRFVISEVI